jgi:menaquinone-dependent protoporphyrinogen oxidase
MGDQRVLVAFANQAGSTAGIATTIASVLRRSGYTVDCRLAAEVEDVTAYDGVVLGSGVFVPRRRSDGGGFLARHETALASRPVWLFCAGPIGRGRCPAGTAATERDDCSVVAVGQAVGARGVAVFGPIGMPADADPLDSVGPVNTQRVRAWAAEIAEQLRARTTRPDGPPARPKIRRCGHVAAAS